MVRQTSRSATETGYLLPLLLCLGALLVLRLAAIYFAKIDLGLDEAQYWTWSRELAFGYFSKPPMIAWVIRGATALCGDGVVCIRSASPLLYTISSFVLFLIGRELFGARVGFWSAIVFDTLPGLSYSSLLITTDVPLILFWTIALYAWVMLVKRQSMGFAVLFGIAVGLGLLTKQAMIYVVLCVACHAIVSREAREALKGGRAVVAALIAIALFAPNLMWNAEHGFPTRAAHRGQYRLAISLRSSTAAARIFRRAVRRVRADLGHRAAAHRLARDQRTVRPEQDAAALFLAAGARDPHRAGDPLARARQLDGDRLSGRDDPRHRGHDRAPSEDPVRHLARAASCDRGPAGFCAGLRAALAAVRAARVLVPRRRLARRRRRPCAPSSARTIMARILVDSREMAAELLYYLRDTAVPLYVWPAGPLPNDQYEMTRAYHRGAPEPVLFVSLKRCPRASPSRSARLPRSAWRASAWSRQRRACCISAVSPIIKGRTSELSSR